MQAKPKRKERRTLSKDIDKPIFSEIDLAFHNTPQQCLWMAIGSDVFDVPSYLSQHPGGSHTLEYMAGLDATQVFDAIHATKPVPAELLVGEFKPLADAEHQIKLIRLLTICMNVCQVEFRSICEHKCLDDPAVAFDYTPPFHPEWTPYISPVNLMLLLRYFRKVFTQLFTAALEAAEHYLAEDEATAIAKSPALREIRETNEVPANLRQSEIPDWVGPKLHIAKNNLIDALNEVGKITASDTLFDRQLRTALLKGLNHCAEPAAIIAEIYSDLAERT